VCEARGNRGAAGAAARAGAGRAGRRIRRAGRDRAALGAARGELSAESSSSRRDQGLETLAAGTRSETGASVAGASARGIGAGAISGGGRGRLLEVGASRCAIRVVRSMGLRVGFGSRNGVRATGHWPIVSPISRGRPRPASLRRGQAAPGPDEERRGGVEVRASRARPAGGMAAAAGLNGAAARLTAKTSSAGRSGLLAAARAKRDAGRAGMPHAGCDGGRENQGYGPRRSLAGSSRGGHCAGG